LEGNGEAIIFATTLAFGRRRGRPEGLDEKKFFNILK